MNSRTYGLTFSYASSYLRPYGYYSYVRPHYDCHYAYSPLAYSRRNYRYGYSYDWGVGYRSWYRHGGSYYVERVYNTPVYYYQRGNRYCSYTPRRGYHYRRCGSRIYRVCRPYYYFSPSTYGWYYDSDYGYTTARVTVLVDDDYETEDEEVVVYRDSKERTSLDDQEEGTESSVFTESYDTLMDRGAEAFSRSDYDGAVEAFRGAAVAKPGDGETKLQLGNAAMAAGRYALAAYSIRRAFEQDTDLIEREIDLADYYNDRDLANQFVARISNEANTKTGDKELAFLAGFGLLYTNQPAKAAEQLERAISLGKEDNAAKALYQKALKSLE